MTLPMILEEVARERATRSNGLLSVPMPDVLQSLYDKHYSGTVTLHFQEGRCQMIEVPNPITIRIET